MGKLIVVGIGPGDWEDMTVRADRALRSCDVIVGYHVYVDLVRDRYPDKEFLTTGMTRETDRCRMALEAAREGKTVAMVCSGDSGIYGMAGLIYELRGEAAEPEVEVIPGLTAACSGGALLGAPLTHDFAVISLSDRLTPGRRSRGGCPPPRRRTCPSSSTTPPATAVRTTSAGPATSCWRPLPPQRLCGVARNIRRAGESAQVMPLGELRDFPADMFCTVFIGNSQTRTIGELLVTPRGYRDV